MLALPARFRLAAAIVAGAFLGSAAALHAPDARAALPTVRSVQIQTWWNTLTDAELARTLDEARSIGATAVRTPVFWPGIQPSSRSARDPHYTGRLDALAAAARSRGLKLLVTFMGTPCWASSYFSGTPDCATWWTHGPEVNAHPPKQVADWSAIVRWLLSRHGGAMAGLEIWNEPNLAGYWLGTPAQYVQLAGAALQVRKQLGSAVPIIGGAVAGSDTGYLARLYAAGLARESDAVSVHPYDITWGPVVEFNDPAVGRSWDPAGSYATGVPAVRSLMVANGDSAAKLWITEFGYATCPALPACVSAEQQAAWLGSALTLASGWAYLGGFSVFTLADPDAASGNPDFNLHFGLSTAAWQPKPARAVVSRAFRG